MRIEKISSLERDLQRPNLWDNPEAAQKILQELALHQGKVKIYYEIELSVGETTALWQLAVEEDDGDLEPEIEGEVRALQSRLGALELEILLSGAYDRNNAILTLHAGAGGTEAQDWVQMLYRLYVRWGERRGYKVETLDLLSGDEAGIKSATISFVGENAYGYAKAEKGVHRLVRISPFDASGRRHTSFASVDVMPEVSEADEVAIEPEDLRVDTFRSGGAGGQHVNKTDSAIRITHLPTKIVVQCQSERSQIQNKAAAMRVLQARLLELRRKEQEAEMTEIRGEQQEIAWGSQIRSYVFHPYNLVKDHRVGVETSNVTAVMDGDIDAFVAAYLQMTKSGI